MTELPIIPRCPSVARAVAARLARREVERELKAQGLRVTLVLPAKIVELTRAYLAAHPELLTQAIKIVLTHPGYRRFVEQEERERERQRRKLARMGILDHL